MMPAIISLPNNSCLRTIPISIMSIIIIICENINTIIFSTPIILSNYPLTRSISFNPKRNSKRFITKIKIIFSKFYKIFPTIKLITIIINTICKSRSTINNSIYIPIIIINIIAIIIFIK